MSASLQFYFDTHISPTVATQLRQRGVTVVRCEEVGLAEADDVEHLEYAASNHLTLVSHDRDFWALRVDWLSQGLFHGGMILFHRRFQGNVSKLFSELYELHQIIQGGAGTLDRDIYNRVYEIK